jgi:hypothetical protein
VEALRGVKRALGRFRAKPEGRPFTAYKPLWLTEPPANPQQIVDILRKSGLQKGVAG